MLVVTPTRLRIQPMGWRGWVPTITAPSTPLPIAATSTSGHPWMPTDFVDRGGYDATTSTVSTTVRATLIAAVSQAIRPARTSARLAHDECRNGRDHIGAPGVVGADREIAVHRVHAVAHVPEAPGRQDGRHVETLPVVADQQREPVPGGVELDLHPAGRGMLDGVLHSLDAAEVQRRLERLGVPSDAAVDNRDPDGAGARDTAHHTAHRSRDAIVGQALRIDPARELDQRGDRVVDRLTLLGEHRAGAAG